MNNQEIFDKVAKHLIKQNQKSVGDDGLCLYRTNDGLKCAVGCLIPKRIYSADMEGNGVRSENVSPVLEKAGIKKSNIKLIDRLQEVHDYEKVSEWKQELAELAKEFKLKVPSCLK